MNNDTPPSLWQAYVNHNYARRTKDFALLYFTSSLVILVLIFMFLGKVPPLMIFAFCLFLAIGVFHGTCVLIYGRKK
ncbi:hypothetical protein [Dictyobacter arantiisoli]|uniref:hypothetical protein n=1 Tax=Dictyobacter arantiisoli TaxID=2014874 RepID=UPI0011F043A7|nr:hypothetical protein [Dictyobacter arantiisoli]